MKLIITTLTLLFITTFTVVAQTFTEDNIRYEVLSQSSFVRVIGENLPNNIPLNLVIPETVSNAGSQFTVIEVRNDAFNGANVASVSLPNTILEIDNGAFINNPLTTITIPDSVTRIGLDAFKNCTLETVDLGVGLEIIDNGAFLNNDLTSITIPASVTTIGNGAFNGNSLEAITSLAIQPPTIIANSFGNRTTIDLIVPEGRIPNYQSAGWTGFASINGIISIGDIFESGDFLFEVTSLSPNEVAVVERVNAISNIVIPASVFEPTGVTSFSVTSIGGGAFRDNNLTSVSIPNSVTSIGKFAFFINQLTSVIIPDSVTSIGDQAFRDNDLTSVIIPDSVTSIGAGTFFRNQLTNIIIPNSVTSIEALAFATNFLTTVSIPNSIVTIERDAFKNCNLSSITLGAGLEIIDNGAFLNNDLTSITIPASVTTIGDGAFNGNPLSTINVEAITPSSTFNNSFGNRSTLSVTVPQAAIDAYLDDANWANFFSINDQYTGNIPFDFTSEGIRYRITEAGMPNKVTIKDNFNTGAITIPGIVTENNVQFVPTVIGNDAFNSNNISEVSLPNTILEIDNGAFINNPLTEVIIPDSVVRIGLDAFKNCTLETVDLGVGLEIIDNGAFLNNDLTSITIPASVTTIGNGAFNGNISLASVESFAIIPPSLIANSFGNRATIDLFVPQGRITSYQSAGWTGFATINDGDIEIGDRFASGDFLFEVTSISPNEVAVVERVNAISNIVIPASVFEPRPSNDSSFSVTSIGSGAFFENNLESVDIPDSVTSIGNFAFGFNNLTSVVIPDSVVSIGKSAFSDNQLTSVVIPDNVTTIGIFAFFGNQLTSVVIPDSITSIRTATFRENNLESVDIPDSVTSIGRSAFEDNQLTSITIPNSVTSIGDFAFRLNNLTSVTIPNSVTSIDFFAFRNNPLTEVISEGLVPASIKTGVLDTFGDRSVIDLTVPNGLTQAYLDADWINFASINDGEIAVGDTFESGDFKFEVTSLGPNEVAVVDLVSTITDIVIPSSVFESSGVVSFSVTSVGDNAFLQKDLTSAIIPNSITSIGIEAFRNNNLTSINIPNSVTFIGGSSFRNNALTSIDLGNSVTTISSAAFANNFLTSVSIPDSVLVLGEGTFATNELISIELGASLTNLGGVTFVGNDNLATVVSKSLNPAILPPIFFNIDSDRSSIDLFIPEGTTQTYLDADWTGFASINDGEIAVGDTFESGDFKFEITSLGPNEVAVVDLVSAITDIVIPSDVVESSSGVSFSVTSIGSGAFFNNDLESVIIPNSVTVIGNFSLKFNQLTNIIIPDSVVSIGPSAFSENQLTSVSIPNSVTTIGIFAFSENQLTSVDISNSVTSIGEQAFLGNQLTSVVIPDSVTSIGIDAFRFNNLTSITIPNSVTSIGERAFSDNPLTVVISEGLVPASITTGTNDTFGDRSVINLTVPNGLTQDYLDADWINFASINDGEIAVGDTFESGDFKFEITSLGPNEVAVVDLVSTITDIVIPSSVFESSGVVSFSVTSVGDNAFLQKDLTSAIIPNSIVTIGEFSFNTNALTSIEISSSVTSIRRSAFANNLLASISIPDNVTIIGETAFAFNPITTVSFGTSVTSIEASVFQGNPSITTVTSLSVNPAILPGDAFDDRGAIDLFIPEDTLESYLAAEWTDFASIDDGGIAVGDTFESGDFMYEITSLGPNEVAVVDLVADITVIEIPSGVSDTENEFSVTAVGERAFSESGITSVVMPNTILTIGDAAFLDNVLSTIIIPNSVTSIGVASFAKNFLESVTIPASMTSIGNEAFGKNPLTQVVSLGVEPASIGVDTFGDRFLITLTIPEGTLEAYIEKEWTGFLTTIENGFAVGDTFESGDFLFEVTRIGPNEVAVIDLISEITRVEIPSTVLGASSTTADDNSVEFTVTAIGDAAFLERNIGQVFIPDSVISIGIEAFAANVLERLRLGNNVATIEKAAFAKNNLAAVFIPASVTFIGDAAFDSNPLTAIISQSTDPATISEGTFGDRSEIDLTIPLGTFEAYIAAEWTGFKTFTETEIDPANRSSHSDNEIKGLLVRSQAPEVSLRMSNESVLSIQAKEARIKEYTIYNMFGIQVAQGSNDTVSLAHLSRGIYIVHIHFFDAEMIVKKVIK